MEDRYQGDCDAKVLGAWGCEKLSVCRLAIEGQGGRDGAQRVEKQSLQGIPLSQEKLIYIQAMHCAGVVAKNPWIFQKSCSRFTLSAVFAFWRFRE